MADALLSPVTGVVMLAVAGGLTAHSVRAVRKDFNERRIPLMGVAGAFVFAAQMVNFSIPGTGSSGHIAGAVLLAALLGPAPAFLTMACVLLVQALFFADGGLLAFGCNLVNLGFFGCFIAYPYIFRPLAGNDSKPGRIMAAACVASIVSLELGALGVTLETLISGITKLPFAAFATAMLPIHLAIGLGEGLATGAVLLFVRKNLPDLEAARLEDKPRSISKLCWRFGLAALLIGGGLSLLASQSPDGLEWSMERITGSAELESSGAVHTFFTRVADFFAVLPDYQLKGQDSVWSSSFAGIAGTAFCGLMLALIAYAVCFHRRKKETTGL
ncbi:MAG: energy-coupling factor ABC transporter permease [Victivallaceae bacterium]|nr:energy-coupling factor ABC transporter permease [Victivallaceae bacterium]